MSALELSAEQRAAIAAPGNVLVRAGAGSGKTEVLARRFVAMLAGDIAGSEPVRPDQLVAITFTEKAAYDLRRRIVHVLDERLREGPVTASEADVIKARRMLPLAQISTIHAFCAHLLRENALAAGLDPRFEVLDEYESRTFIESAVEQLLVDAVRAGEPGAIRLVEVRGLRGSKFRPGALRLAAQLIADLTRLGKDARWLRQAATATTAGLGEQAPRVTECASQLRALIEELLAVNAAGQTGDQIRELRGRWPRYSDCLARFAAAGTPEQLEGLRDLAGALPKARAAAVKQIVNRIRALLSNGGPLGLSGELIEAYGAYRAIEPVAETAELIARLSEQLEARKRRDGIVTFDDLLSGARRLLREHDDVRRRYRSAFRAILVDEYQDTDPVQDEIIAELTEPRDGCESPLQLYIVGDEKQSIYRFRGAQVTVFNRPRRPAPISLPLRENRRSVKPIVDLVNAMGAKLMKWEDVSEAPPFFVEWSDVHRLIPLRSAGGVAAAELLLIAKAEDQKADGLAMYRDYEAHAIANRIAEVIESHVPVVDEETGAARHAEFADIAILLRSFEDVAVYERALEETGIPFYTVKGRGFFGCSEILDLANLLTAIEHPDDAIALAATLRSPLFALSDQCLLEMALHTPRPNLTGLFSGQSPSLAWLESGRDEAVHAWRVLAELRAMRERCSLSEIIEKVFDLTDYEAVMLGMPRGRQRLANLHKLTELALRFESRRFFTFGDFVAHLRGLIEDEPREAQAQILGENENVVRLMTIHQAKGLEFPIVIVADLGRGRPIPETNYLLSPERGLLVCDTIGSGHYELPNALIKEYREELKLLDRAEGLRLLYVAMTRARDCLILSEGAGAQQWAGAIRDLVGRSKISAFVSSGKAEEPISIGDAQIVLRRANGELRPTPIASVEPSAAAAPIGFESLVRARIAFDAPPASDLVVSPTELADFARCPRQYFYRHRLGIAEHETIGGSGGALELGTIAHSVLQQIDLDEGAEQLQSSIEQIVQKFAAGGLVDAKEQHALVRDLVRYAQTRAGDADEQIIGREVPFFLNLARDGMRMFVRGQIDVIVEGEDRLVVRDYKYSDARTAEAEPYRLQMECYALAVLETYPKRKVNAEVVFIRDGIQTRTLALRDSDSIRAELVKLGSALLSMRGFADFGKKPSGADECRKLRCGYIPRCWGGTI